jgi:hypothetical protein
LEEEVRLESAGRFLSGSFTAALHAVWRDFAALGSPIAVLMVAWSALAIADMLGELNICPEGEGIGKHCTCEGLLLGEL